MEGIRLNDKELEELDEAFGKMLEAFPEARMELVEATGEKMYQAVMANIRKDVKPDTGNLMQGVKKVIGSEGGYAAVRPNHLRAPHSHLVENGHELIRNGASIGWVEGKHMYRNALNQTIDEIQETAEDMIEKLVGDCFGSQ